MPLFYKGNFIFFFLKDTERQRGSERDHNTEASFHTVGRLAWTWVMHMAKQH